MAHTRVVGLQWSNWGQIKFARTLLLYSARSREEKSIVGLLVLKVEDAGRVKWIYNTLSLGGGAKAEQENKER